MPKASAAPRKSDKLWTPANVVTLVRICLVPVFVAAFLTNWPTWFGFDFITEQAKGLIAAALFVLISCTDWLDGYLARSRNEVTDFGKFLDPLADKILVAAALIALVELHILPSWPVLIILGREFIISGVRMIAASKGEVIAASWYGKFKTVFQIIAIVMFIVKYSLEFDSLGAALDSPLFVLSWAVMAVALLLTVLSMMDYLSKARHLIGFKPKEGVPAPLNSIELNGDMKDRAAAVVEKLAETGKTVATAESLTGGMICTALTSIPGSSQVVMGSIVSYTNDVKQCQLSVAASTIDEHGAVSEAVAIEMAKGVRDKLGSTFGVAVTGIAGPTGEEPGKPVGTVWVAVAADSECRTFGYKFEGSRDQVRLQTSEKALFNLLECM